MLLAIFSYIFNFIGLFCFIVSYLVKGKKMGLILALNCCGNALIGVAYVMGGNGINGAISSFLGTAQAVVNYVFAARDKKLPVWLIVVYAAAFVGVNLWVGGLSWNTAIAIIACLCSVMSLVQNTGRTYRFWALGNNGSWCVYDAVSKTYGGLIIHAALTLLVLIGILLYGRKKEDGDESSEDKVTP